MTRQRYNNQQGTIGATLGLTDGTITFDTAPDYATLTAGQTIILALEPGTDRFEIVALTAYTAGSLTGSITRAAVDGTNWPAVQHDDGAAWVCAPVADDFTAAAIGADASGSASAAQSAAQASSLQLAGGTMAGPLVLAADPTTSTQAATKAYVDATSTGLTIKNPVVAATAGSLTAYSYLNGTAGVGATITAGSNGALVVDGYTTAPGDRILVKNGAALSDNGIYTVTQIGDASHPFILTRATDNDQSTDFVGAYCFTLQGTVNQGAGYVCANTTPPTVGTTSINWGQFTSGTTYTADGVTMTLTGTQFSVHTGVFLRADGTQAATANLAMGTHKITGLTNGSAASDAAAFGQIPTALPPNGSASGDLTGTYPGPTLAAIGSATGPSGSATVVPVVTIDTKGRVTALTTTSIQIAESQVTNLTTDLAAKAPTTTGTSILKGNGTGGFSAAVAADVPTVAAGGTGALAATDASVTNSRAPSGSAGGDLTGTYPSPTLAAAGPGASSQGGSASVPVVTIDAKGRVTGLTNADTVATVAATDATITVGGTATAPTIQRAALTGDVTTSVNAATVAAVNGVAVSATQAARINPATALYLNTNFR